jgi:hypothetical protein
MSASRWNTRAATACTCPSRTSNCSAATATTEGLLDRLGGGAWQAKKARLKERIRQIADKLIRVAAERELRSAPILEPPGDMWEAFCARFPYEETDDQLSRHRRRARGPRTRASPWTG